MCADTHVKTSARPLSSSFGLAPPVASTPRTRGCDATDLGNTGLGLLREPPRLLQHWQTAPDTHVSACPPSIQAHLALSTRREEEIARDHASAHCHRPHPAWRFAAAAGAAGSGGGSGGRKNGEVRQPRSSARGAAGDAPGKGRRAPSRSATRACRQKLTVRVF
jgi:hypothetical protein